MRRKDIASHNWSIKRLHRDTGKPYSVCRRYLKAAGWKYSTAYTDLKIYGKEGRLNEIRAKYYGHKDHS